MSTLQAEFQVYHPQCPLHWGLWWVPFANWNREFWSMEQHGEPWNCAAFPIQVRVPVIQKGGTWRKHPQHVRETTFWLYEGNNLSTHEENNILNTQETHENNIHVLAHSLAPRSRVLLEKLGVPQLVETFSTFYGCWRFSTMFTTAHLLSLSWDISVSFQPTQPGLSSIWWHPLTSDWACTWTICGCTHYPLSADPGTSLLSTWGVCETSYLQCINICLPSDSAVSISATVGRLAATYLCVLELVEI